MSSGDEDVIREAEEEDQAGRRLAFDDDSDDGADARAMAAAIEDRKSTV